MMASKSNYQQWQMEKYGNIIPEFNSPLISEDFENGQAEQDYNQMISEVNTGTETNY